MMSMLDRLCKRWGRLDVTVACKGAASSSRGRRIRSRRVLFPEGVENRPRTGRREGK
jgi:hypothetical protein